MKSEREEVSALGNREKEMNVKLEREGRSDCQNSK